MFTRDVTRERKVVDQVVARSVVHEANKNTKLRTANEGVHNDVISFIMTVLGAAI